MKFEVHNYQVSYNQTLQLWPLTTLPKKLNFCSRNDKKIHEYAGNYLKFTHLYQYPAMSVYMQPKWGKDSKISNCP